MRGQTAKRIRRFVSNPPSKADLNHLADCMEAHFPMGRGYRSGYARNNPYRMAKKLYKAGFWKPIPLKQAL